MSHPCRRVKRSGELFFTGLVVKNIREIAQVRPSESHEAAIAHGRPVHPVLSIGRVVGRHAPVAVWIAIPFVEDLGKVHYRYTEFVRDSYVAAGGNIPSVSARWHLKKL